MKYLINLLSLTLVVSAVVLFPSCNKKGCTDATALNYNEDATDDDGSCTYSTVSALGLNFYPMVGGSDLVYNQEYMVNGRKIKFTAAQFYVSAIQLQKQDNSFAYPGMRYALVHSNLVNYSVGEIEKGQYKKLEFSVGVDSVTNHADETQWGVDHPLYVNNQYARYWSWSAGYVFVSIQGKVDTTLAGNGTPVSFAYDIGNDEMLRNISLTINKDIQGSTATIDLNIDYAKLFENVDFKTELQTHAVTADPLSAKIADKIPEAITIR